MMCTYFVRRCWSLLFCKRLSPFPPICMCSTGMQHYERARQDTQRRGHGQRIYDFYSLLCRLVCPCVIFPSLSWAVLDACPLFFSCSLYRVHDVYGDPPVSRRVRSERGP